VILSSPQVRPTHNVLSSLKKYTIHRVFKKSMRIIQYIDSMKCVAINSAGNDHRLLHDFFFLFQMVPHSVRGASTNSFHFRGPLSSFESFIRPCVWDWPDRAPSEIPYSFWAKLVSFFLG
jgi:hypothetical protein